MPESWAKGKNKKEMNGGAGHSDWRAKKMGGGGEKGRERVDHA